MNDITKDNFETTVIKHRKNAITELATLEEINGTIIDWTNGIWSTRRPNTPIQELVADLIFAELEGWHGCQTFSIGDFLESWDNFVVQYWD